MSYLLDTNAVSEWVKPRPNLGLVRWLDEVDEDRTFLSALTLGELRKIVERLPAGPKRERLTGWLVDDLMDRFAGRILAVDATVAHAWGQMLARAESAGRSVPGIDGLIAATALAHRLDVVTRNAAHFDGVVDVINPWTA